jgi:chaperone BCS1
MLERLGGLWSALAGAIMLAWNMLCRYLPRQLLPGRLLAGRFPSLRRLALRLAWLLDPYLVVTVAEYGGGDGMRRGDAYEHAAAYLGAWCSRGARSLRLTERRRIGDGTRRFALTVGDGEEVADEFRGATVWWRAVSAPQHHHHHGQGCDAAAEDAGRAYRLVFHHRHRDLVVDSYLPYV